jgi:hypothetical protein
MGGGAGGGDGDTDVAPVTLLACNRARWCLDIAWESCSFVSISVKGLIVWGWILGVNVSLYGPRSGLTALCKLLDQIIMENFSSRC